MNKYIHVDRCGNTYTEAKETRRKREREREREGLTEEHEHREQSIVIPANPSFQHARSRSQRIQGTMTTMTMVTMMSMTNMGSPLVQWSSREAA